MRFLIRTRLATVAFIVASAVLCTPLVAVAQDTAPQPQQSLLGFIVQNIFLSPLSFAAPSLQTASALRAVVAQEDGEQSGPEPEQQQQYDPPTQPAPVDPSFGGNAEAGGGGSSNTGDATSVPISFFDPPAVKASGWGGGEAGFQQQGPELGQEPVQYKIQDTAYTEPDYIPFTQVAQQPTQPAPVDSSFGGNAEVAVGGGFSLFKEPQQETPELGQEPVQYKTQDTAYTELDYMPLNQAQAPAPEQQDPLNAQLKANGTNAQNVPPAPLQAAWDWFVAGTSGNINNDGQGPENGAGQGGSQPIPVSNLGTTLDGGMDVLKQAVPPDQSYIFSRDSDSVQGIWREAPTGANELAQLKADLLAQGRYVYEVKVGSDGEVTKTPVLTAPTVGLPNRDPNTGAAPSGSAGGTPSVQSLSIPRNENLTVPQGLGPRADAGLENKVGLPGTGAASEPFNLTPFSTGLPVSYNKPRDPNNELYGMDGVVPASAKVPTVGGNPPSNTPGSPVTGGGTAGAEPSTYVNFNGTGGLLKLPDGQQPPPGYTEVFSTGDGGYTTRKPDYEGQSFADAQLLDKVRASANASVPVEPPGFFERAWNFITGRSSSAPAPTSQADSLTRSLTGAGTDAPGTSAAPAGERYITVDPITGRASGVDVPLPAHTATSPAAAQPQSAWDAFWSFDWIKQNNVPKALQAPAPQKPSEGFIINGGIRIK